MNQNRKKHWCRYVTTSNMANTQASKRHASANGSLEIQNIQYIRVSMPLNVNKYTVGKVLLDLTTTIAHCFSVVWLHKMQM